MQLDKMKKADLVDLARKLTQELKMSKKTEAKADEDLDSLPLVATSVVRKGKKDFIVKIKFDFETGKAGVVERLEQPSRHMCLFNKEKMDITEVEDQEIKEE